MDTRPPWKRTREEFSAALKRSSAEPKAQAPWPKPVQAKARQQAEPVQAKAPGHLGPGQPMGSAPGQLRLQQPKATAFAPGKPVPYGFCTWAASTSTAL
jgi:hypothetical protein